MNAVPNDLRIYERDIKNYHSKLFFKKKSTAYRRYYYFVFSFKFVLGCFVPSQPAYKFIQKSVSFFSSEVWPRKGKLENYGTKDKRKPTILMRMPGASSLRYANRLLTTELNQLPPRKTREFEISEFIGFSSFSDFL